MDILIIDGQGGNLGKLLTKRLREALPQADITAVGTNSTATENMLKGGADRAATGENAVIVNARRARIIAGPLGIVIADALLGEVTPAMAMAVDPGGRGGGEAHGRAHRGRRAPDRGAAKKS